MRRSHAAKKARRSHEPVVELVARGRGNLCRDTRIAADVLKSRELSFDGERARQYSRDRAGRSKRDLLSKQETHLALFRERDIPTD